MSKRAFRIGVVGFSRSSFDQTAAIALLRSHLKQMLETHQLDPASVELVSGYTRMGVPELAYQVADELGLLKVGFSAEQARRVRCGVCRVHRIILEGKRFGDESKAFVAYIDALIRIGGGPQSRHEVELFKACHADRDLDAAGLLLESEVTWFGK